MSAPELNPLTAMDTRVLIVDDDNAVCSGLTRYFKSRGYDAVGVESGRAALTLLGKEKFDVMISDIRMPELTGIDLLAQGHRIDRDLAIIMLTGVNDASTAAVVLGNGASDYLVKPVEFVVLEHAIKRAIHRRRLEIDRRNVERMIRDEVAERTLELEREKHALHKLTIGVADVLISAMEAKDVYLLGHSRRVAELAASVAEALGLDADVVENVRLAGRLHDVGKIGVREEVLNKEALSAEEFEHIKNHVDIGMQILAPLKHMPAVLEYVLDHHEHFDGHGYPRGIAGEQISVGGRILAACDAYDALTSKRAFREAMSPVDTIAHLEKSVGKLLDPEIFAALKRVVLRRKTLTFIDDRSAGTA